MNRTEKCESVLNRRAESHFGSVVTPGNYAEELRVLNNERVLYGRCEDLAGEGGRDEDCVRFPQFAGDAVAPNACFITWPAIL